MVCLSVIPFRPQTPKGHVNILSKVTYGNYFVENVHITGF